MAAIHPIGNPSDFPSLRGRAKIFVVLRATQSVLDSCSLIESCRDPRIFQILFLGLLLMAGVWLRDFSLRPAQALLTFAAAIAPQNIWSCATSRRPIVYRSAIITALSLTLLLRSGNLWVHPLAATVAISSKFILRIRRKHLFNPANFGVIIALGLLPGTWVSPGQWGQDVALAGWLVMLGGLVSHRARRADISWTFLTIYLGLLAIRVAWLGQRAAVWIHQLSNGALLLFTFFMISDPMTTPNARRGRLIHAAVVALAAYEWQFGGYYINGFLWALFFAAPLVPLWDALWPASNYQWSVQGESAMLQRISHKAGYAAIVLLVLHRYNCRCFDQHLRVLRILRRQGRRYAAQPRVTSSVCTQWRSLCTEYHE